MSEHEIIIRARLEGEEEVSEGFRRMGESTRHISSGLRSLARDVASLGAAFVAVGKLGEHFGFLNKQQSEVLTTMGSMVALSGHLVRGLAAITKTALELGIVEKVRGAAHTFANTMASGITSLAGSVVSALRSIASSSIAVAIAEKTRAAAHTVAHALSGPAGWALLAASIAAATAAVATVSGLVKFAEGGIVYKPTVALVGEREPEAIVPLSKISQSWTSKTNYIFVTINEAYSPRETSEEVINALRRRGVI